MADGIVRVPPDHPDGKALSTVVLPDGSHVERVHPVDVDGTPIDYTTDVSSLATQSTLEAIRLLLDLEDFAQEATIERLRNAVGERTDGDTTLGVIGLLKALKAKDFATDTKLESVRLLLENEDFATDAVLRTIRDNQLRRTDPIAAGSNILGFISPSTVRKVLEGKMYRSGAEVVTSVATPNASLWLRNPQFLADGVTPNTKTVYLIGFGLYADAAAPVTIWEDAAHTGTLLTKENMLAHAADASVAEVRAGAGMLSGGTMWSARTRVGTNSPVVRDVFVVLAPGKSVAIRFQGPGATNTVAFNGTWYEE